MKITKMSKEDFAAVPELNLYKDWNGRFEFKSFVIIPTGNLHDSGYGCMEFVLVDKNDEPLGKVGGGCDIVNIDGIGGYGYKLDEYEGFDHKIAPKGWTIDCLPCGYLNVWARCVLFITDKYIGSTFEPYSEDLPRPRKE